MAEVVNKIVGTAKTGLTKLGNEVTSDLKTFVTAITPNSMQGGGNDTCGRVLTIMVYVIVGMFLFTLICDLCSEGYEYFNSTSTRDTGFEVQYYKRAGCPWCVKFDNSNVFEVLAKSYGDNVSFKTYDIANPAEAQFVPKIVKGFPAFAFYKNGKVVDHYPVNGDRSVLSMSAWIDNSIKKSQQLGW
jgi:hypothetical protein